MNDQGPALVPERTSGFTAVTRPLGGRYCLAVDDALISQAFSAGIPTRPAVATIEYGNTINQTDPTIIVEVRANSIDCPPNTFEVMTLRAGDFANDVAFTMMVP